jgi:hypothetical protein
VNRTQLPLPPDPSSPVYAGNPLAWARAAHEWMLKVKEQVETDSEVNTRPITPFVVGTYTAVNTIAPAGTDTTGNFVATLVTAMQAQGFTAQRNAT